VIGIDTNILIYAHRKDSPWHVAAAMLIKQLAEGMKPWFIPWPCLHEFIAIVSHPRIYLPPSTLTEAFSQIDAWINSPSLLVGAEGTTYLSNLKRLSTAAHVSGPMIHDARIAALCVEHDVDEFWSADRDFSRFSELKVRNPL
jgi:hypothetical protein